MAHTRKSIKMNEINSKGAWAEDSKVNISI